MLRITNAMCCRMPVSRAVDMADAADHRSVHQGSTRC